MRAGRDPASALGRAASAVRQHFADPTYYARRFRTSRVGGKLVTSRPDLADTAATSFAARLRTWLRSYVQRPAERQTSSPSAFDRWHARPAVFIPAVLIGSVTTLATLDTPRTAPLASTLLPIGGVVLAWTGLRGAADHIRSLWHRAERLLFWAWLLLALAEIVAGLALMSRAVSQFLVQLGLWSLFGLIGSWWKGRPGQGRT